METILANLSKPRREVVDGKTYLVAPATMIVPGVLNGSQGALFYPPDEISRMPDIWNGVPVVIGHPQKDGKHVSARDPHVLRNSGVGYIYHSRYDNKLVADAWIDVDKIKRVAPELLSSIEQGLPIEVSTGLFTEQEEAALNSEWQGKGYTHVAKNYRPDHLAILPGQVGACSVKDGCGLNVNKEARNAFCPTGEGGGQDNSCSSRGGDGYKGKTGFYRDYHQARGEAQALANLTGHDVAIAAGKEYGKKGYSVRLASRNDSDYARAEIVKPGEPFSKKSLDAVSNSLDTNETGKDKEEETEDECGGDDCDCEKCKGSRMEVEKALNQMQPSDSLDMTPEKACKILKDGTVHGKELTKRQRGMFGALCGQRKE